MSKPKLLVNFYTTFLPTKTIILFVLIVSHFSNLNGQSNQSIQNKIDSLKNIYHNSSNDTIKLEHLTLMARNYRYQNIDSAKFYLWKAIAQHKVKNVSKRFHVFAYNVIGDIYRLEPNIDSTKYYYEEAYHLFNNENDVLPFLAIAPTYGNFLVKNDEADKGIKILEEAISLAKKHSHYKDLSFLYHSLSNVFFKIQKNNEKAIEFIKKGLLASEKIKEDKVNYHRLSCGFYLSLSDIYLDEGKIDSTIYYANKSIEQAEAESYYQKIVSAYNNLCISYLKQKKYLKAKVYNDKALLLSSKIKSYKDLIESQLHKQKLLIHFEDYNTCIKTGNSILNLNKKAVDNEMKAKIYENLCECYTLSGDKKNAIEAKDSLVLYTLKSFDTKHDALLAKMYNEFTIKEQKAENKILKANKEAAEKSLENQEYAALGLIAALIFSVGWVITFYRSNLYRKNYNKQLKLQVNKKTEELQKANDELGQTNYELSTLIYIASHDIKEPIRNIGNYSGLIRRKLSKENQEKLGSYFETIQDNTNRLYVLIEDFSDYISLSKEKSLKKVEVDLDEVIETIKTNLLTFEQNSTARIYNLGLTKIKTSPSAIFIILKKLIENGIQHNDSKIPKVEIFLEETESHLKINIKDNGIGIAPEYQEKIFEMFKRLHDRTQGLGSGIGLSVVKLLANKLNITIEIESSIGNGCQFILSVPKVDAYIENKIPQPINMEV